MSLRVAAVGTSGGISFDSLVDSSIEHHGPKGTRSVYLHSTQQKAEVPVYEGSRLRISSKIEGPAIVEEPTTTIFVPEYFDIELDPSGSYLMVAKGYDRANLRLKGSQ